MFYLKLIYVFFHFFGMYVCVFVPVLSGIHAGKTV